MTLQKMEIMSSKESANHGRQPSLTITEQPADRIRYRYKSEKGSHGGLTGKNSTASKRTYPTVKLEYFQRQHNEQVFIKATLYSVDELKPHVHKLMGKNCKDGICMMELGEDGTTSFVNLWILLIGKKEVPDILYQRKVESQLRLSGSTDLTDAEKVKLHEEAEQEAKDMDLNRVRICFEAFSKNPTVSDISYPICQPKFSNNIANQKCPDVGELKIVRISKCSGVCTGNEEVFLLCEKVNKKDIKIRFYEEDSDGRLMWEDYGNFSENDVHHQVAIVFRTPAYKDCNIKEDVRVKLQLYRLKDSQYSESKDFQYTPAYDREEIERKRRKITTHQELQVHHDLDPSLQSGAGSSGSTWVDTDYQTGFFVSGQSPNLDVPEQHAISSTHFETHYSAPGSLEQINVLNDDDDYKCLYLLHPSSNPMLSNEENEPNPLLEYFKTDSTDVNPKHPTIKVNLEHAIKTLSLDDKGYKQNVGNSIPSLKKEDKVKNGNSGSFTSEQKLEPFNIQRRVVLANRDLDICAEEYTEESLGIEPQTVQIGDSQLASKFVRTKGYELKPKYIQSEGQVEVQHLSFSEQDLNTEHIIFKTKDLERSRSLSNPRDFISLSPESKAKILETSDPEENRSKTMGNCRENKTQSDALPTTLHGVKQLALRMSSALRNFVVTGDLGLLLMTLQHLIAIQDEDGDNALHLTIIHQAKQHIQQLVLIRCLLYIFEELPRQVINDCNNLHQTPLFLAVVTRSHKAIPLLLMSGADANIPDNEGNTPLHIAVREGNLIALHLLLDRKNYPKSVSKIVDIDKLNYEGLAPLHVAVINNKEKCIEKLCTSGADINVAVGTSGNTSLHLAVEIHPHLVRLLLAQHDINVDVQNFAGNTALHLACTRGFKDVIISLMEAEANPFIQNFNTTSCLNQCSCEEDVNYYNLKGQMATDLVAGNYELIKLHDAGLNPVSVAFEL
ncbi:nuclear factor NF-kappa-B p105 subunit-like [Limulus polyphemus]|uniref:Nuclear factor NF-kappa-B p105 subunit-like n=1 Tax=Limulus polyphemus TaxID=6850 RepID=A0ABM1S2I8_LIMPO|nr:nuclear factor NF-kappa-B p105 subunit-like [Limulus polyphemus]